MGINDPKKPGMDIKKTFSSGCSVQITGKPGEEGLVEGLQFYDTHVLTSPPLEGRKLPPRSVSPQELIEEDNLEQVLTEEERRFELFLDTLPLRSVTFVLMVRHGGTISTADVETVFRIKGKQIGGLTGSIARWAKADGLSLPYEALVVDDKRAWRWIGFDSKPQAAPPIPRVRRATVRVSSGTQVGNPLRPMTSLKDRFLELVQSRGTVSLDEVIERLGLTAKSNPGKIVGGIISGLKRGRAPLPFRVSKGMDGRPVYTWIRSATKTVHLPPDQKKSAEISPGVRRRRRSRDT